MHITLRPLVSIAALVVASSAFAGPAGSIVSANGAASVVSRGSALPAATGRTVGSGDALVTGSDGRIQVQTADEAVLVVTPNSRLRVENYNYAAGQRDGAARYRLDSGAVGTLSGLIQSQYALDTPAGQMTIHGTKFGTVVCASTCGGAPAGTYLAVVDGAVTFTNQGGALTGTAGQYLYAPDNRTAPVLTTVVPNLLLAANFDFTFSFDTERLAFPQDRLIEVPGDGPVLSPS